MVVYEKICGLLLGYLFGCIQARHLYKRIHSEESGFWKKAGFIAYFIDCLKVIVPVIILGEVYAVGFRPGHFVTFCYSCLGSIIGHNYPFYIKFKGDRNTAAYWGVVLYFAKNGILFLFFCLVAYFGELYVSGDRSKAWLKLVIIFTLGFIICCYLGHMPMFEENLLESSIIIMMTSILAYVGCKSESMNKKQLKVS